MEQTKYATLKKTLEARNVIQAGDKPEVSKLSDEESRMLDAFRRFKAQSRIGRIFIWETSRDSEPGG